MPDAKTLNAIRAAFMRRASAPDVPPLALKLAYLIAYKYLNNEIRTARPSQETLARDLRVSVRTVQRLLDALQPLGLVIVPGHGPNRSATYWIDPDKATPVSPINTTPMSPIGGRNRDNRRQRTRQPATEKATPMSPQLNKKNQEEEPREEYISEPSDFAPRDSGQDARLKPDRKSTPRASKKTGWSTTRFSNDFAAAFAEFWAVYPLKKSKADAEKAFAAAIKGGADTTVLNAGAARYAAERCGQDPKFTKHPAKWIKGECWNDEPSSTGAVTIDNNTGNVVAEADQEQSVDDYLTQLVGPHKNWYGT